MRTLKRNQRKIYYATLIKGEPVTDEWDNETGEYNMVYSDPSPIRINVSAAQGRLETRQFGQMENYDRTLITDDLDCPIDESSILWIDNLDTTNVTWIMLEDLTWGDIEGKSWEVLTIPHDYVVTKVARSLNVIQYAVRKVSVSHG